MCGNGMCYWMDILIKCNFENESILKWETQFYIVTHILVHFNVLILRIPYLVTDSSSLWSHNTGRFCLAHSWVWAHRVPRIICRTVSQGRQLCGALAIHHHCHRWEVAGQTGVWHVWFGVRTAVTEKYCRFWRVLLMIYNTQDYWVFYFGHRLAF